MSILQSIKIRTGLVFVGLVLVTHGFLWAVGEIIFETVLWVFMPFFGLYALFNTTNIVSVLGRCNEAMCEPNIIGWFVLAFNVIVALAVFYSTAKYITRRFWKGGKYLIDLFQKSLRSI